MPLNVDLERLWSRVREMGAEEREVDVGILWDSSGMDLDAELQKGYEIDLNDLESTEGLLSIRGRQVVLYIPDHSYKGLDAVLADPMEGNRFHVADCEVLDRMKRQGRFNKRYEVTNNLSGDFPIYEDDRRGGTNDADSELIVCQPCLRKLNFKGAENCISSKRKDLAINFQIDEFFLTYSSVFKTLPKKIYKDGDNVYSADWKEISARLRKEAGYQCEKCEVNLESHKSLLHVHHINGQKSNNTSPNLVVLCADCHRKEPYHGHLFVRHADVQEINRLRRQQDLLESQDWASVYENADPAVRGVIDHCQHRGMQPPEVGCEIVDDGGRVIAEVELGWEDKKIGVYIGEAPNVLDWELFSLQQAVEYFAT